MQNVFMKKVPQYFVAGGGDTMLYLETFYHLYEFIRNFCGTNYDVSNKTTYPLFLKSYNMVLKLSKLF